MARKRPRRRGGNPTSASRDALDDPSAHAGEEQPRAGGVHVRQIATGDEGVLYTHRITERHRGSSTGLFLRRRLAARRRRGPRDDPAFSERSAVSGGPATGPPPQSETLRAFRTLYGTHQKQYTVASKKRYKSSILNWLDRHHMDFIDYCFHREGVDNNVYRPSTLLYRYIDWTFPASFTAVVASFLFFYFAICLVFGLLLLAAGDQHPECIVASGAPFGERPYTAFSDAFALSWTTFTTVGYGMTYTSTASDFGDTEPHQCSLVVFLCTTEAFVGLLYAGMCAAILFGKVNRVQSHASLIFCNAICLQYEEMEDDILPEDNIDSERSRGPATPLRSFPVPALDDEENPLSMHKCPQSTNFIDQFNGCPILKFQVVNELCNIEGGELVDCIMKVIGIKFKGSHGKKITHSQYVRVNLVDNEHPFLSRAWHCVHVLDSTSPLLTDRARQRIRDNDDSWPSHWFDDPAVIRRKLEFHDLIATVAGTSNRSAVTVHAYKRYKIGDILIGFNFAPIVFRNVEKETLEVDLSMCNDVRQQYGLRGENLNERDLSNDNLLVLGFSDSNIRVKLSKSRDALCGSVHSRSSRGWLEPTSPPVVISGRQEKPTNDLTVSPLEIVSPLEMAESGTSEDEVNPHADVIVEN